MPTDDNSFLLHEVQRYEQRIRMDTNKVAHARSMIELAQIVRGSAPAKNHLRALVARDANAFRNAYERKSLEIVESQLVVLSQANTDEQFIELKGRFIRDTREHCRGYFPQAYQQAERGLAQAIKNREKHEHIARDRS